MKHLIAVIFFASFFSLWIGCSGGSSTTSSSTSSTVTLSPSSTTISVNTTAQFTATVSNSSAGVTWAVNGTGGGNYTVGTITTAGLYTAPAVVPNPATVTVTATSLADASQSTSAKITITAGTALSFSISPTSASVYTGRSQQFTTNFNTSTNTAVAWDVNSTVGGDSTNGTITSTGIYTAPATVPSNATVTITAVSQFDTTKTATATVTILPGSTVVVTPSSVVVPAGAQQVFTATTNGSPADVTWALNCKSTRTDGCGTISTTGVYTAPLMPPPDGVVALTATSSNNSAAPAGASITVHISNGSLAGQYAFSSAGMNGGTAFVAAGSLAFDGSGNITGGLEDVNDGTVATRRITAGSYHIGIDGRGTAALQTQNGTETWQLVLRDHSRAYLLRADGGTVTGAGMLDLQDVKSFTTSSISGSYTLELSGSAAGQAASMAVAGSVTADGSGNVTRGVLDVAGLTSSSTALALVGTYSAPDASGRGTLTLTSTNGTQNFSFYIVDADHIRLAASDSALLQGSLVRQPSSWTIPGMAATYAFVSSGSTTQGPIAMGGIVTLGSSGNVANGAIDLNVNGNWQNTNTVTGQVQVTDAANARAEATWTINGQSRKFAIYPESGGTLLLVEIDGSAMALGRAFSQSLSASFGTSFAGNYATLLVGTDFINAPGELDVAGLLIPNGGSALTGSLDINAAGAIFRGATVSGSYLPLGIAGRATGTLQTTASGLPSAQLVYYLVDANRALVLETDGSRVIVGVMERQ